MSPNGPPPEPPVYRPYTKKGLPRKRPGPPPKPKHELAKWKNKKPLQRVERSYTRERKIEVLMFLLNHRIHDTMPGRAPRRRIGQPPIAEEPTGRNQYGQPVWERAPTYAEASAWYKVPMPTIHGWWDNREKILQGTGVKLPEMPASLPVPEWLTKPLDKNGPQYYPPPPPVTRPPPPPQQTRPPLPQSPTPVVQPPIEQDPNLLRGELPPNQGPPPPLVLGTVPPLHLQPEAWTMYPTPPGVAPPRPTEGQVFLGQPQAPAPTQFQAPAPTQFQAPATPRPQAPPVLVSYQNSGTQTTLAPDDMPQPLPQANNPAPVQRQEDAAQPPPTQSPSENDAQQSTIDPSEPPTTTEPVSASPQN